MGRPTHPGSAAERAQRRRDMVRANVREHRRRKRQVQDTTTEDATPSPSTTEPSQTRSIATTQQVRLCKALDDDQVRWLLQPPLHMSAGPAHKDAFISVLSQRCQMPDHEDTTARECVHVNICCGSWISSACMLAKDPGSHLLNDALLASGLIIVGRSTEDLSMVQAAIELENRVISSLRARLNNASQEIYPQEQHRLTTVVFTIAIAELLAKKSWRAFSLHLKGVGALIEACGPGSLDSQFAIEQFYAYRAVLVPFCFLDRRPSFVCRREWISFPLRNEFEIKYPALEKLVEIILEIPVLIQRFDEQVASEDPRKAVLQLLERARVVCQDMDSWETDSQLQFPWTKPGRRTLFPLRELQVSGRMQLSDTLTANLASFYLGAKVAIHDLCLSILARLGSTSVAATATEVAATRTAIDHTRLWSARAVRCVNSFRELEPRTVGKLVCLLPLDMAWAAYHHLRRSHNTECEAEIRRCEELALEFEKTGLPALRRH